MRMIMREFHKSLAAIAIVAMLFAPAMALAQSYPPMVTQKVQSAQKQVRTIGIAAFRKVIDNPGNALIVDVREPDEYAAGHVPGTINVPRGLLEFQILKHVGFPAKTEMGKTMYIHCQSGNRASLAAKSLKELGFTQVTAVVMNLDDWQKADHPFVK